MRYALQMRTYKREFAGRQHLVHVLAAIADDTKVLRCTNCQQVVCEGTELHLG